MNALLPTLLRAPALALTALAALAFTRPASAGEAPPVDVVRAAKIATDYLRTQGSNAPHIVSLVLEKPALATGRPAWVARWSRPIPAEGEIELGLRVNPDGSIVRLVEGKSTAQKRRHPVGSSLQ
ncbi:MAG: hypothetical protein ABMA01_08730 [Chthoniobacteraceae bacterium]